MVVPLLLEDVRATAPPDTDEDARRLHNEEARSLERAQQREQLDNLRQDREQRKRYAERLFKLVVSWLIAIWLTVIFAGVKFPSWLRWSFELSDSILIALITSTTASVLGLFAIVANYLYPKK